MAICEEIEIRGKKENKGGSKFIQELQFSVSRFAKLRTEKKKKFGFLAHGVEISHSDIAFSSCN